MKPMRRSKQQLSEAACREILARGRECVLALAASDATDGFPYAVPVNYALHVDASDALHLFIHCAPTGAKLDAIAADPRVSVCVIAQGDVVPEEFTTYFRSVIAFGRVRVIEQDAEKRAAAELLSQRFAPEVPLERHEAEIDRFWQNLTMLELAVEHLSGKEAIELVRGRAQ